MSLLKTNLGEMLASLRAQLNDVPRQIATWRSSDILAVTIEHGLVKLLVTNETEVVDHRTLAVSPEFFRQGLPGNRSKIGLIIENAVEDMGYQFRHVVVAVPGYQNNLSLVQLPKAKDLDPTVVIPREARRSMGVSLETSHLTWYHMPDGQDRDRWLVISAARHAISSLMETAKEGGLKVSSVDLRAFALARAVNQSNAVVAWVAPDGCDVVLIKESAPVQLQSLYWGAEPLEGNILVERMSELVERTVAAFNDRYPEAAVSDDAPIFVSGSPLAVEQQASGQIADNLRRPEGKIILPLFLPEDFPLHDLIVNVGLALREV